MQNNNLDRRKTRSQTRREGALEPEGVETRADLSVSDPRTLSDTQTQLVDTGGEEHQEVVSPRREQPSRILHPSFPTVNPQAQNLSSQVLGTIPSSQPSSSAANLDSAPNSADNSQPTSSQVTTVGGVSSDKQLVIYNPQQAYSAQLRARFAARSPGSFVGFVGGGLDLNLLRRLISTPVRRTTSPNLQGRHLLA